ncbi:hypothetical protein [Paenibacillus sp. HJGM_3]|uniref:phage adaptor protein n=1 Tax=Paenibacillus sp. HJGM_3 TaxID=3379816 RepID=UPI0038592AC7
MGMSLQQILDEIKERYPAAQSLADSSIIRKINNLQAELFRTIHKPIVSDTRDIIANTFEYAISYSPSKITGVIVDGTEIYERNAKGSDVPQSHFYYFAENKLCLYPTPPEDISDGMTVFHFQEPYILSTGDTGRLPDFDPDFHMMLVYGTIVSITEVFRGDMRDAFVSSYNDLEREFLKAQEKAEYHVIQDVWGVFP